MSSYDVQSFPSDYCHREVSVVAAAVQRNASLLLTGMPGCGKSRLIDFIINRPDVLARYNLEQDITFVRIDGDAVADDAALIYARILQTLEPAKQLSSSATVLEQQLLQTMVSLDTQNKLVIVFDNFRRQLQRALGESFFNFLFALRNARAKLNVSYLFLTNLRIDLDRFYKVERLFDGGIDRSICWVSLLNRDDAFFSIERQLGKAGWPADRLTRPQKETIYNLSGGHALLNRYLSHLALELDGLDETMPSSLLQQHSVLAACQAIWDDLTQRQKNVAIDVGHGRSVPAADEQTARRLRQYGLFAADGRFFSPIFAAFVRQQSKAAEVTAVSCDNHQSTIQLQTTDRNREAIPLTGLSAKKRKLLCYLASHQGDTCTKDKLKEAGWSPEDPLGVTDQALSRQIDDIRFWLRRHETLSHHLVLENEWGIGYRLLLID